MADWFAQNAPQTAGPPPPAPQSGDWFAKNAPPPPKPPEPSPVAKAGKAFAEGIGLPALLDIIGGANRTGTPQDVAARAERQKAAVQGIVQGIIGEPGRVRQELTNAIDAIVAGNPRATAHHLLNAVPLVGEPINRAAQSFASGDPASGIGQTAAIALPFAHEPIQAGVTRAAEMVAPVARTAADVTAAAVKAGGRDVAVGAGKTAVGAALAKAGPLGEVADILAGLPIVKSGIKQMGRGVRAGYSAGKEALAKPGVTVEQGPPPVQIRGLLPPAPEVIVPEAPALPPDPSFVRAVPAQYPDVIPETLRAKPAASDIAAQLEASMRTEALTDYVIRNKIPAAMLEEFGPKEWQLVADQAGVKPPTPENIQAIRGNLAEHEGASQLTAKTPAAAVAEFETKRAVRTKRKGPAAATEPSPAIAIDERIPEAWRGAPPPAAGPPAPSASQLRVEALAKHLAADTTIGLEDLATVAENPNALRQLDALGRALGVKGSLAPGEALQIVDRVRQLRTAAQ